MTNLHSNSLPATSCELPASLQLSALSRACHAHNRVCYRDSHLMTQTAVLVMQTAVSICSVLRDLLCCRVCQHWLSPKESNRCEKSPWGIPPPPPAAPSHPSQRYNWTNRHTHPQPRSACTAPRSPAAICRAQLDPKAATIPAPARPHPQPHANSRVWFMDCPMARSLSCLPWGKPARRRVGPISLVDISPIPK